MTTQYNIVSYGTLTNTNGVLSDFSASNYATIPLTFNPVQHPYEIVFKINTETMPTDAGGIIWQTGDVLTSRGRLDLEVSENKLYAEYAANGALVWNIDGITTLSSDTDYWVKLTYNGVNTYGLYLSTDGTTWTTEGTATSSGFLGDGTAEYNIIGVQPDEGSMIAPWFGSIDLNGSYININNIRWWQGVISTSNVQTRIQLRHDIAANWTLVNPVLLEGEVGIETDTGKQKFGDGTTAWNSLAYSNGDKDEIFVATYGTTTYSEITTALANYKTVICKDGNRLYYYIRAVGGYSFGSSFGANAEYIFIDSNSTWSRGSIFLANRDLSNVTSINSGSAVATALDAKVNKSGDTMTGGLTVRNDDIIIQSQNAWSSTPSTQLECGVNFQNNNGDKLGYVNCVYATNGARLARLNTRNADGSANSYIEVGYNPSGNAYCTFPNTTRVDGQWDFSSPQTIISTAVSLNGSTDLPYTVTLPNDGHIYEVMIRADANTGNTTGNWFVVGIKSNVLRNDYIFICGTATQAARTAGSQGTVIIPMKYGTNNLTLRRSTNYTGSTKLSSLGYRRVGTNS